MKFQQVIQNDKGIAVLLGLFVLFVVTIAGITLILISQRDKIASADACAIRNVAFAADASLKACEGQLAKQPDTVVAILNKYVANNNYKWLLNPSTNTSLAENKISLGSGLKYSACITAYDKDNMILQIKGIGYGSTNEQKNVMGLFKLNGVEIVSAGKPMKYALYSVNSMIMDKIMNITGDVYMGNGFTFNGGAQNSVIHGFMKTGMNTSQESFANGSLTIDSALYMGTSFRTNASLVCKSAAGFQGRVTVDNTMKIQNDAWFNDTNAGNQNIDMSGKTIHHSGHITMFRISNGIEDNKKAPIADIAGQLGFSSATDTPWSVNISTLTSLATPVSNLNSTDLQKIYDTTSNSRKINGYIVLKDQWGSIGINGGSGFKGKVIWLISNGINVNGNWFKADTSSRMLIYAYNWSSLNGFGSSDGMVFKGFICLNDSASFTSGGSGNNYYYGAIHAIHSKAKLQVNNGAQMFLYYNDPVLSEFVSMGILKRPPSSAGSSGAAGTIALKDCKIRPEKVGVIY